tara:strand:- start:302 stop:727 length:426 start_codon:yes stop_codon:yes gene_type:complete
MSNTILLIEGIYVLLPCLLIVLMFYIESNIVTERERETKEYFKIFFVSFLLIGIARYCFTFYYDIRGSGSRTSITRKSKSIKTGGQITTTSENTSSSPLETISNTVSTIVEKIAPTSAPVPITETATKIIGSSINPNLPDF